MYSTDNVPRRLCSTCSGPTMKFQQLNVVASAVPCCVVAAGGLTSQGRPYRGTQPSAHSVGVINVIRRRGGSVQNEWYKGPGQDVQDILRTPSSSPWNGYPVKYGAMLRVDTAMCCGPLALETHCTLRSLASLCPTAGAAERQSGVNPEGWRGVARRSVA